MAEVRDFYVIKNDHPESLSVYLGYIVHKDTMNVRPVRVVQRDRGSVIDIVNGGVLVVGVDFYYDPELAINEMVAERKKQIAKLEAGIAECEAFRQRVIKAKKVERDESKS